VNLTDMFFSKVIDVGTGELYPFVRG